MQLDYIFKQINGLLLTGGKVYINIDVPIEHRNESFNKYSESAKYLLDLAIKANENGDYFPVLGIC